MERGRRKNNIKNYIPQLQSQPLCSHNVTTSTSSWYSYTCFSKNPAPLLVWHTAHSLPWSLLLKCIDWSESAVDEYFEQCTGGQRIFCPHTSALHHQDITCPSCFFPLGIYVGEVSVTGPAMGVIAVSYKIFGSCLIYHKPNTNKCASLTVWLKVFLQVSGTHCKALLTLLWYINIQNTMSLLL